MKLATLKKRKRKVALLSITQEKAKSALTLNIPVQKDKQNYLHQAVLKLKLSCLQTKHI